MKKQDTTEQKIENSDDTHAHDQCDCDGQCDCKGQCECEQENSILVAQLESIKAEAEEWKAKCMRALADYQNIERRSKEEKNDVRLYASESILGRLLPVVDTFGKVKAHIKDVGFDLAYKELVGVLEAQGVTKIDVVGKEFNPHEMECIEVVEGEDNIVVEETAPGYKFYEKILRVAQVKVGKKIITEVNSV